MRRRAWLVSSIGAAATGCGFQLRGAPTLPFRSVALIGFAPRSPLADALKRSLEQSAQVVDTPARAEAVLQALADVREKSVVASTAAGQVREIELRVRFGFRLAARDGRELLPAAELVLSRDMSYNETAALAKEQEESQLYRAMDGDIVAQVMRRLSAVERT